MMGEAVDRGNKKIRRRIPGGLYLKLTLPLLLIITGTFLVMMFICIVYYKETYQKREISSQIRQMDKAVYGISTMQGMVENVSKQVAVSEAVQEQIKAPVRSSVEYFVLFDNIQNALRSYIFITEYIQELLIYTKEGDTYSSSYLRDKFDPQQETWYLEFKETGKKRGYTCPHMMTVSQNGRKNRVISYVMTYYSISEYGREMGDMIISLDYETVKKWATLDMSLLEGYGIYNERGELFFGSGKTGMSWEEIMAIGENQFTDKEGNIYLVSDEIGNGWTMVTEISARLLQKQILFMEVLFVLVFLVLAFLIVYVLSNNIKEVVESISHLKQAVERFGEGDFDVSINVSTGDEVEVLVNAFNKMVHDVQRYTEKTVEQEKIIQRSEVDQLLLQINPHFIYNTLNSIVYMAHIEGNSDIEEFVNAFISLLQNTLRVEDKVYATLGEELKNVENYLILQKYRYMDKFEEEIICPGKLKSCLVPKVILQPVVENAIFHGIAPLDGKGRILISAGGKEDKLCIVIEDNGVGMSEETRKNLFDEKYFVGGGMRKIGIANVYRRIKKICGEEYGLHIESEEGRGTRVIIELPVRMQ